MKKNLIAMAAGAALLCLVAAGCGSKTAQTTEPAATAATESAAAATTAAAVEEKQTWKDDDSAYLSGITASDYVELPEDYKYQKVEAAKPVDPTDEEVEKRINTVLQSNGTPEEVDRKVKEGDIVNIDYVGKIDGEEFEGGSGNYDLLIGSGSFIEGFEEGLIDAKKGETLDLNLKFPENYPHADVAGKDVVFTVTVNKVSAYNLTDDFVKGLNLTNEFGQAVTDVDSFREYIRSNMIEERESSYAWLVKHQIDNQLLEICTFKQDIPEAMQESYYFQYTNYFTNAASSNYMDLATFMQMQYGASADNYEDIIRDFATQAGQLGVIYQAIADERDLNPTEEEVQTAIGKYIESDTTGMTADSLERYIKEYIRDELMSNRVRDWLYEHCDVTEPSGDSSKEDASTSETAEEAAEADSSDTADTSVTEKDENAETSETADSADSADTADTASTGETAGDGAQNENR